MHVYICKKKNYSRKKNFSQITSLSSAQSYDLNNIQALFRQEKFERKVNEEKNENFIKCMNICKKNYSRKENISTSYTFIERAGFRFAQHRLGKISKEGVANEEKDEKLGRGQLAGRHFISQATSGKRDASAISGPPPTPTSTSLRLPALPASGSGSGSSLSTLSSPLPYPFSSIHLLAPQHLSSTTPRSPSAFSPPFPFLLPFVSQPRPLPASTILHRHPHPSPRYFHQLLQRLLLFQRPEFLAAFRRYPQTMILSSKENRLQIDPAKLLK